MEQLLLFKNWAARWMELQKQYIKESTFAAYQVSFKNHLNPMFGENPIDTITEEMIQLKTIHLCQAGKLNGSGGLARKTVRDIITVLCTCLKSAMHYNLTPHRDFRIQYPREDQIKQPQVLQKEDQKVLIHAVQNNPNVKSAGILLTLGTGLRIGELCALQWKDINLADQSLLVRKTVQRVLLRHADGSGYTKVIFSTPKTKSSVRQIPIPTIIYPLLCSMQCENLDAYLLTGSEKHMEPRTYRSYYQRFLKRNGVRYLKFHGLRHTFATRCIEAGADYKTISEILGHSTVSMTLNLYVHPQMEQKRKCIELLYDNS